MVRIWYVTPYLHLPAPSNYSRGQEVQLTLSQGFRLDVNPSLTAGGCASPNVTINNQPLLSSQDGSFVLDNDIKVDLEWESRCFPSLDVDDTDSDSDSHSTTDGDIDSVSNGKASGNGNIGYEYSEQQSQLVTLNLKTVDGQPVKEDLTCTIWFRQEEPVWAFGVAGWCIDARIRDVRGKNGGWEVVFDDDDATHGGNALGEEQGGKGESREMRLMRERKEFEWEVECLEYRRSLAADQNDVSPAGHGYAQKPFVSMEYEANRQRLETLCANFTPRANEMKTASVHPPWQLPQHRPAKPARLPFPGLFLDSSSPTTTQQRTLAALYASLCASIHAHLTNLSPTRLASYIVFLSLPIFACVFSCLRRLYKRRRNLAQQNGGGEPEGVIESLCPGFYGSDESCGECKARYLAHVQAESNAGSEGSDGDCEPNEVEEKTVEEQEKAEEVPDEKDPLPEVNGQPQWAKEEKERLSEREYQQYREYHTVPEDGFALRYEPGSETQTIHEPVDQQVGIDDDDDDARTWDEKSTLVDSEDEREKESTPRGGDEVGESSNSSDASESGGEDTDDDDDDLSIGGELASFMMAANLVEDMIRAGARREEAAPRPTEVGPVSARRQSHSSATATSPPPSYREVVGLRAVGDDEGLPPRYVEYLRSRR